MINVQGFAWIPLYKMKVNEGEFLQYYVENSYLVIVSAEMFDMAQEELDCRTLMSHQHNGTRCFVGTIYYECCGGMYGSRAWQWIRMNM